MNENNLEDNPILQKTILLIDGFNIVRRVYGAIQKEDGPEKAEGALISSMQSIRRAIKNHSPDFFLIAFDYAGKNFRHDLLKTYKEKREPMHKCLADAMPGFIEQLHEEGLMSVTIEGVEAEDTLASVALKAIENKLRVVLLSTDKDTYVLSGHGVELWNHFSNEAHDEVYIQNKFGIPSSKMNYFLALTGDASDGIPGVPRIGSSTAAKLINKFSDLEKILSTARDTPEMIPGVIGENLVKYADSARLSYQLVLLKTDVKIGLTSRDLSMNKFYSLQNESAMEVHPQLQTSRKMSR